MTQFHLANQVDLEEARTCENKYKQIEEQTKLKREQEVETFWIQLIESDVIPKC